MVKTYLSVALSLSIAACGSNGNGKCDVLANSGCGDGKVCEYVSGSDTSACFSPVEVDGKVLDLSTNKGVANARVVAVDINGIAVSSVATSASDGTYKLRVPVERASDGTPISSEITLRADAQGYQSFPGTIREPLPSDTGQATLMNGTYVLQSSITDIGLFPLSNAGTGKISGKVDIADDHPGVLVVAELNGKGSAVIASYDGNYTIFNLDPGHYAVTAYARGHVYTVGEVDVATSAVTLDLKLSTDAPGTLTGNVNIVNPGTGNATSVVVFVESTYDPTTGRGVPPPNLRAPESGPPSVTNAFTIDAVPPGKYVVVAGFENDNLVRDPDHCIAGTADVHVTVTAGQTAALPTAFKVTGALDVMSPGANMAQPVTSAPTLLWADDAGEDQYLIEVFDAFGQRVWMTTIPGVNGGQPSVAYGGPMTSGMYYQFRVTSLKQGCELSRTEDLRGVFVVQ
jgi:hypothetical protein